MFDFENCILHSLSQSQSKYIIEDLSDSLITEEKIDKLYIYSVKNDNGWYYKDALVFTNKRILIVKRQENKNLDFTVIPYSNIINYSYEILDEDNDTQENEFILSLKNHKQFTCKFKFRYVYGYGNSELKDLVNYLAVKIL